MARDGKGQSMRLHSLMLADLCADCAAFIATPRDERPAEAPPRFKPVSSGTLHQLGERYELVGYACSACPARWARTKGSHGPVRWLLEP
jgi:hypothetical protein